MNNRSALVSTLLLGWILVLPIAAQVTPSAVLPSPGSQANGPTVSLQLTGVVQVQGSLPSPTLALLGPASLSTTLAYTSQGSVPLPGPGYVQLAGAVYGLPTAPLLVAVSVQPGSQFCGGFANWPCMTGPRLFSSMPSPSGMYHLDLTPVVLLDGFGLGMGGLPAFLDLAGTLPLSATIPSGVSIGGGVEQSFAVQGLSLDPGSPTGFSFTACLTVDQWLFYL
jgi:hypothetical protein